MSGFAASIGGSITQNWNPKMQVIAGAAIGGTAECLGGGKFSNGAITGAFTVLFNHLGDHGLKPNEAGEYGVHVFDNKEDAYNMAWKIHKASNKEVGVWNICVVYDELELWVVDGNSLSAWDEVNFDATVLGVIDPNKAIEGSYRVSMSNSKVKDLMDKNGYREVTESEIVEETVMTTYFTDADGGNRVTSKNITDIKVLNSASKKTKIFQNIVLLSGTKSWLIFQFYHKFYKT